MNSNKEYIPFEEASEITGINKYKLGRIKNGYLKKYIKNKEFNIRQFEFDRNKTQEKRNLAHTIYYILSDIYKDDESLSDYCSVKYGRTYDNWFKFFDVELFSTDKNEILMTWYEEKMINELYEEAKAYAEAGEIIWEDYFY